jgi:adenylate cyclase
MPPESESNLRLEIGHVLFIDLVGYSKLLIEEQKERLRQLTDIVLATEQVREATNEQLVRLPTGDGMALVFRNSAEEPAQCALEIAQALKAHPDIAVRMGIHSGPVSEVTDVSGRTNITGGGINMAQRVVDCGDAGHILLTKHVANDLQEHRQWSSWLHDLGECEVKHGVRLGIVNLYRDGAGNPQLPNKFRALRQRRTRVRWTAIAAALLFFAGIIAAFVVVSKTSAIPGKSIAVLPFLNLTADKDDEYLSDGMTEELLTVLSKVKGLRVPGRSSCFAFKGKNEEDIFRKVGQQLHVAAVLEGSVRKAGENLRITAQLINVADGYQIWSETYNGEMKDILSVESDVAQRVVEALKIKLGVDQARLLTKKATENPEAHRLYLLGRYYFAKSGTAGWTRAMQYFNQAIQLDPNYALAYCGLADIYSYMGGFNMPGKEAWAKEKELAQKALALDPDLAEAHLSLGEALVGAFHWRDGENEIKRALELNPNLALAYDADAWVLAITGRFDEAIAQARKTSQLDPLNPGSFGFYLYLARRYDEAMAELRRVLELVGDNASGHSVLGWCLIAKGDAAGAIAEQEKAKALDDLPIYDGCLGCSYGILGDRAKAKQVLTHLTDLAKQRYVSPQALITVYIGLGEKSTALDWLEKSYEDQDIACWYLKVDPVYDSLRNEPRFQALLKKLSLDNL